MTTIYVRENTELPERAVNDVYTTERTLIRAAISGQIYPYYSSILDIGAGADSRWGTIARELSESPVDDTSITGVELRDLPRPEEFLIQDLWYPGQNFLTWNEPYGYDLIVSNPPYSIAEEVIRKGWEHLDIGGTMVMLLRLAFQASIKRYNGLWAELPPHKVLVCSRRPSFYGGGTNGDEYAVYYWTKDDCGKPVGHGNPRYWTTGLLMYERDKDNA